MNDTGVKKGGVWGVAVPGKKMSEIVKKVLTSGFGEIMVGYSIAADA